MSTVTAYLRIFLAVVLVFFEALFDRASDHCRDWAIRLIGVDAYLSGERR